MSYESQQQSHPLYFAPPQSQQCLEHVTTEAMTDITQFSVSHYNITPYHPKMLQATINDKHLYLFHPNDPRITKIGQNIHRATFTDLVGAYTKLMTTNVGSDNTE